MVYISFAAELVTSGTVRVSPAPYMKVVGTVTCRRSYSGAVDALYISWLESWKSNHRKVSSAKPVQSNVRSFLYVVVAHNPLEVCFSRLAAEKALTCSGVLPEVDDLPGGEVPRQIGARDLGLVLQARGLCTLYSQQHFT